jgi:hypothetical protein
MGHTFRLQMNFRVGKILALSMEDLSYRSHHICETVPKGQRKVLLSTFSGACFPAAWYFTGFIIYTVTMFPI